MSYNRRFIILNKFDEKFCREGATGYCKIDAKDDKSKFTVFVQGLKDDEAEADYFIYLVNSSKGRFVPVFLGNIILQKGMGEASIDVDTRNVCESGLSVFEFDLVAVFANNKQNIELSEVPLVGYYDAPLDRTWRNNFLGSLKQKAEIAKVKKAVNIEKPEINERYTEPAKQEAERSKHGTEKSKYEAERGYSEIFKNGSISEINEILSRVRDVQEYNPFEKVKLKYKWWKVANGSFLDSIFKFNVASSQVVKHPLIKKLLHQSSHCLFGIVSDVDDRVRFMAFGFPAVYSMKDQLYIGGFATFYPSVGYDKRKGDHGYWVVHIKLDDGSISMTV